MKYKNMFQQNLIDLMTEGQTKEDVFKNVASQLKEFGYVNERYAEGIISREENFPTGLLTQYLSIALPHSEPMYVKKPFVFIARSKHEIAMKQMGNSEKMNVKNFFFLGITEPKDQVGLLQSFMKLFMDKEFVHKFSEENDPIKVIQLFKKNI